MEISTSGAEATRVIEWSITTAESSGFFPSWLLHDQALTKN
jgi:hypothetical protein